MSINSKFIIRQAHICDINGIISFIKTYWKTDHIYVKDKNFFKYDFLIGDEVNYIIAVNSFNDICGILGFISYNAKSQKELFTVMWKVIPNSGDPMLGIRLLKYLIKVNPGIAVSTVGANSKTLGIYKHLGFKVGKMEHFFIPNTALKGFSVLKADSLEPSKTRPIDSQSNRIQIQKITPEEIKSFYSNADLNQFAIRTFSSFDKRYLHHPYYEYQAYGIFEDTIMRSLVVMRELVVHDIRIGRIVDYLGSVDCLRYCTKGLNNIIKERGYEYIDFYEFGIQDNVLLEAGFVKKNPETMVIPNYFEPFLQENVDIHFFTTKNGPVFLFKGHGDQDRPSISNQ